MSLMEALNQLKDRGPEPGPGPVNAHLHLPPNFSAFGTVGEAAERFGQAGMALIGASNYYDFEPYGPFITGCLSRGIAPLLGIEILCRDEKLASLGLRANDPVNPGKVYLCGKGLARIGQPTPRAAELLGRIRKADSERMSEMAFRLGQVWAEAGCRLPDSEQIRADVAARTGSSLGSVVLQERHLAEAGAASLQPGAAEKLGLPANADAWPDAVRAQFLKAGKPAFVEESYVSLEEGIELVRALGGEPAYPVVAETGGELEQDPEALAAWILAQGMTFAEWIPSRNAPEVLARYVEVFKQNGLPSTSGTEHNSRAMIPLVPQCRGGAPVPPDCEAHFAETAWLHLACQQENLI